MNQQPRIIILAAGMGKRMYSNLPKVLHPLAGKPLLEHVVQTALMLSPSQSPIVIYGHDGERVRHALGHFNVLWVEQNQQLGTGHAALQALPHLGDNEQILILYGDVPLIRPETLENFIQQTPPKALGLLTGLLPNPSGFGRIIRDGNNNVKGIVEEKDADEETKQINEVNSGIYYVNSGHLKKWLPMLSKQNSQSEYYLTDIVSQAIAENINIHVTQPKNLQEILGVNDKLQLNRLERFYQYNYAQSLMKKGVSICDVLRLDVRGELIIGKDVYLDANVIIEGRVIIGNRCTIGPQVYLRNAQIGDGVEIKANSVIDGAEIARGRLYSRCLLPACGLWHCFSKPKCMSAILLKLKKFLC